MRLLSKSRYKLGLECPNKLYFTGKREFVNRKQEDTFLQALAQGGYQVEELAKLHYPGGIEIERGDYQAQWRHTQELLQREEVIIYQASLLYGDLFAQVDILEKKGDFLKLIEVKAKSFDPDADNLFVGKRGGLKSGWKLYLFDLAYQDYLLKNCFPGFRVNDYLLMADKSKTASIGGLNQMFRISSGATNRLHVDVRVDRLEEIGNSVLSTVNVTNIIDEIQHDDQVFEEGRFFESTILELSGLYKRDEYANAPTSYSKCKNCEFQFGGKREDNNKLKSGLEYCLTKQLDWTQADFDKQITFDLWNFRRGTRLWSDGLRHMDQLEMHHLDLDDIDTSSPLTPAERQWLQASKASSFDNDVFVLRDLLQEEMDSWTYPLHFIDFETSAVALPFHEGMRPYEQVAFQFSHHKYHEDGTVEHADEFIEVSPGVFPNFDFVRALKQALDDDQGTIFRYAAHENTILNAIHTQLLSSDEEDRDELLAFIESISHSTDSNANTWRGDRDMVDLRQVIVDFYYNPYTNGSNSMKKVLLAVLKADKELQSRYVRPLKQLRVSSLNYPDTWKWIKFEDNEILDPYSILPSLFEGWSAEQIEESLSDFEDIKDGGAAMVAYAKLQFVEMAKWERQDLIRSLLKYCELDTLAMVMVFEHLKNRSQMN